MDFSDEDRIIRAYDRLIGYLRPRREEWDIEYIKELVDKQIEIVNKRSYAHLRRGERINREIRNGKYK